MINRDDLYWKSNTNFIMKKAEEMLNIYFLYIRSVVEQAAVVWLSSITKG